jgi:hypothetical protein
MSDQSLFPNDTVQSRLPDPEWLRAGDTQINFDKVAEEEAAWLEQHPEADVKFV